MDREYALILKEKFGLEQVLEAHHEHSTEVQVPLIHELASTIKFVELVYGDITLSELTNLVEFIVKDEETLLVVSSDLSHYYNEEDAHELDAICVDAIKSVDYKKMQRGEACGKKGIEALLSVAKSNGWGSEIVHYCTSGDSKYGDKGQVVGYVSAVVG